MNEMQKHLNFINAELTAGKYEDQYISRFGSHFSLKFDHEGRGVLPAGIGPLNTNQSVYFAVDINNERWSLPLQYVYCFDRTNKGISAFEIKRTMNSLLLVSMEKHGGIEMEWEFISPFYPQDRKLSTAPFFYVICHLRNISDTAKTGKIYGGLEKLKDQKREAEKMLLTQKIDTAAAFRGPEAVPGKLLHYELGLAAASDSCSFETETTTSAIWDCLTFEYSLKPGECGEFGFILSCFFLDKSIITCHGEECSFYYQSEFSSTDEVISYARSQREHIIQRSTLFDSIFIKSSIPQHIKDFICWNFHIYTGSAWLLMRQGGKVFYTNYEGGARYFSTVDVEYNLGLFYALFWPELISDQLELWEETYYKGNRHRPHTFGPKYRIMEHDIGAGFEIDEQMYVPGPMPVEENSNFILLHFLYYKYTGDSGFFKKQINLCLELADYIVDSDTNGNGLPDIGTNNTLDSFEDLLKNMEDQIFLGVKAGTALIVLCSMLEELGIRHLSYDKYRKQHEKIFSTVENEAWAEDHYVITTSPKKPLGWDRPAPLTTNGLAYLFYTGCPLPMSLERLRQDILKSQQDYSLWPSMGVWRDMTAMYLGIMPVLKYDFRPDFRNDMYPRSINSAGIIQAYAGIAIDIPGKIVTISGTAEGVFPLTPFADWDKGVVPFISITDDNIDITNRTECMEDISIERLQTLKYER